MALETATATRSDKGPVVWNDGSSLGGDEDRGIPCLGTTHADYFYGEVPVTQPMMAQQIESAYEWETGNVIVERFQHLNPTDMCAVLVYGHGPFVWGPTGKKAVENALALEIVAEMALNNYLSKRSSQNPIS